MNSSTPQNPPAEFRSPKALVRRCWLWFMVVGISAMPSFTWALGEYDRSAMLLGIFLFAVGMFLYSSTNNFYRFSRIPFMRRTMYFCYGVRIFISVLLPIGAFVDLYPGLISVMCVDALGFETNRFMGTLITTLVQGFVLNLILALFMGILWLTQYSLMTLPDDCKTGCKKCGYDLSRTPNDSPCPECGSVNNVDEMESNLLSRTPMWALITIAFCTWILLSMLVSIMEF